MSSEPSSLESAFRRAAVESPGLFGVGGDAMQIDNLRGEDGKLPSDVFRLMRQDAAASRGRGRPKGAGNKRNEQISKLIIHKYGDPVEAMAALAMMPLDQLVELLLIADGTMERQRELDQLTRDLGQSIRDLIKAHGNHATGQTIDRLADACEALESVARRSQGKPGDIAIKALQTQLAAMKGAGEYVHSKKPVEATINVKSDGVLVFPGGVAGDFNQLDEKTRAAAGLIESALASGQIDADQLAGMRLVDGQLVDAEWSEVDDGEDQGGAA